jgi:hypothetical protein
MGQSIVPSWLFGVAEVSTGYYHTCARRRDGPVYCWGSYAQDTVVPAETSVPANLGIVTRLRSWAYRTCAVVIDGTIECWGDVVSTTLVE